jgi:Spy/CpxP family protein refolding chaperone
MTRNKPHALVVALALLLCVTGVASFAPEASAQSASAPAPQTEKPIKVRFEVLHTFTYSPAIRDKMQNIFNAGGYQYGDKVVVWYKRGEDVAFKIKGKPSKPK